MRIILIALLSMILVGCKTNKVNTQSQVVGTWNPETKTYEWDQWDYYIDAIKRGKIIFTWPSAIFVYLISNVKVQVLHPEETDRELMERLGFSIIIFRWSW